MIAVSFTGTRDGLTEKQSQVLFDLLYSLHIHEFHHGDCIGSDSQAHSLVNKLIIKYKKDIKTIIHPPSYDKYRAYEKGDVILKPKSYLDRNKDIVDRGELLIATPSGKEKLRSGTWSTIRYARKKNKSIYIIFPDGKIIKENFAKKRKAAKKA